MHIDHNRGFESAGNIADMMQSGIDFVMPCTVSSKAVKKSLKEVNARFTTRTFSCENDVSREIEDVLKKHRDSAYDVEYDITSIRIQKKREKRGCPPKRWIHKFDT